MMVIDLGDFTLRQPRADDLPALYALTEPAEMREFLGPTPPSHADSFARLLRNAGCWSLYGYGTEIDGIYSERTEGDVAAFQRHFRPEKVDGIADFSTIDTLHRLLSALPRLGA